MSKFLKIIGTVAPTLATAFGGPLAGMATYQLGKVLLGQDDATDDQLSDFILANQNPETLAKMKAAEFEFKSKLAELEINLADIGYKTKKLEIDDRVSARDMAAETKSRATAYISVAVLVAFASIVVFLFLFEIPEASRPVLYVLIGALATALTQVMNFWFGSSNGSKVKEQQIGEFMNYAQSLRGQIGIMTAQSATPDIEVSALAPPLPNPAN